MVSSVLGACAIRQYLTTERKHALIKKYALNKHVRLLTRLYGISLQARGSGGPTFAQITVSPQYFLNKFSCLHIQVHVHTCWLMSVSIIMGTSNSLSSFSVIISSPSPLNSLFRSNKDAKLFSTPIRMYGSVIIILCMCVEEVDKYMYNAEIIHYISLYVDYEQFSVTGNYCG